MKTSNSKSTLLSLLLSLIVVITVLAFWEATQGYISLLRTYVAPVDLSINWWQVCLLILMATVTAFLVEKISIKRLIPYFFSFLGLWLIFNIVAAKIWEVNFFFLRTLVIML